MPIINHNFNTTNKTMNETNKKILTDIADKLEASAKPLTTDNVEDWVEYGKRMMVTINTVTPIIRIISNYIELIKIIDVADVDEINTVDVEKEDLEHLKWLYHRLTEVHGEKPEIDYIAKMKKLIDKLG